MLSRTNEGKIYLLKEKAAYIVETSEIYGAHVITINIVILANEIK